MNVGPLKTKIKSEEGFSSQLYRCPADYWTIGYGFNLEAGGIPEVVADYWLSYNLNELHKQLRAYDWIEPLDDARKVAIYDMAYQMGVHGLMAFGKMISAIKAKNWQLAHDEMLDSRWAKQTPNRANRNAQIMLTGVL